MVVIDGDAQNPVDDVLRMHRQMKKSGVDVLKGRRIARFDGSYRRVIATLYKLAFALLSAPCGTWAVNRKPEGLTRRGYEEALKLECDRSSTPRSCSRRGAGGSRSPRCRSEPEGRRWLVVHTRRATGREPGARMGA